MFYIRALLLGAAAATNPNVLFIVADDLRPYLGCYNASFMKTPSIDAMAAQGTVFNNAFVQQAVCGPSRTR
jgi:iduronate 2-sulfatase